MASVYEELGGKPSEEEAPEPMEVQGTVEVTARKPLEVKVVDIEMSFMAMVTFMVKAVFAAIPAALIVLVLGGLLTGIVAALFGR